MSQNVLIQNEQVVGAGVSSASQISYDNSGTSLPNNVQGAISSLNVNLTNILKVQRNSFRDVVIANGNYEIALDITNISGYTPIGIIGHSLENRDASNVFLSTIELNGTPKKIKMLGKNSAASITLNPHFDILYIKGTLLSMGNPNAEE